MSARSKIAWIWTALALAVLAYCQFVFDGKPNSDAENVLIVLMGILSFPSSFLAGAIAVGIAFACERLFGSPLPTSRSEMFVNWALFFAMGYLQWFVLVPRIWSRWRARKNEGR